MTKTEVPQMLKAAEVCRLLSISRTTLHRMNKDGRLPFVVVGPAPAKGGLVRYREDDALRLLAGEGGEKEAA